MELSQHIISYAFNSYDSADLQLIGCGLQLKYPEHNFGPTIRKVQTLQYILDGKGLLRIEDKVYPLQAGDMFYLPTDALVYYEANDLDPYTYYWITLCGSSCPEWLTRVGLTKSTPVHNFSDPELAQLLSEIHEHMRQNTPISKMLTLSKLYALFARMLQFFPENQTALSNNHSDYINSALQYIKDNYDEELSVNKIASNIGLNRTYFSILFKKHMGISPVEYLINYRLSQACKLFKQDLSITEIGYLCGFSDSSNFSVRFKKSTGYTPKEYRKLLQSK